MLPSIDHEIGRELLSLLSGEYVIDLCDGKVRLHCTQLPGDAVSAAMLATDGVLHVFIDLEKPAAYAHGRQMLREWLQLETGETGRVVAATIEEVPR